MFNKKVSSSNGDSNFGVVFTTGHVKRTVYLDEFKEIIDRQVA